MRYFLYISLLSLLFSCGQKDGNDPNKNPKKAGKGIEIKIDTLIQIPGVSFRGLHVTSNNEFWAAGSNNTIVQMIGDSIFHYKIADSIKMEFRDISVWDKTNAIAMSIHKPAKLFKTDDYGYTWTEIFSDPDSLAFFDGIEVSAKGQKWMYADPINGKSSFYLGRQFTKKHDKLTYGQQNVPVSKSPHMFNRIDPYTEQGVKINRNEVEAGFAASGTTIALTDNYVYFGVGGSQAAVYRYDQNGMHWDKTNTPIKHGTEGDGIYSIAFLNDNVGIATGGSWEEVQGDSVMAYTTDAGKNWTLVQDTIPNGYRSCVAWGKLGKKDFAVCCGTSGSDISWDNGKTWSKLNQMNLNVIEFSGNIGFAADSKGFIYQISILSK